MSKWGTKWTNKMTTALLLHSVFRHQSTGHALNDLGLHAFWHVHSKLRFLDYPSGEKVDLTEMIKKKSQAMQVDAEKFSHESLFDSIPPN